MPRDYKHRATPRRRKRRNGAPRWLWIVAILAVGLFIAFLFYLQQRPSQPSIATPKQAPTSTPLNVPSAGHDVRDVKKQPATPKVPPPPKPRFDFYTILPEAEVLVPEKEITGKPREGVPQVEAPGTYFLQVGSFSTYQQADLYKAKLALLGLKADIQKVDINKETRHRVRVGPFNDLNALNTARVRLNDNKIDAILLRVNQ